MSDLVSELRDLKPSSPILTILGRLFRSIERIEADAAIIEAQAAEIERLREAAKGSLVIVNAAVDARKQAESALNREQDNIYTSFDKWSKALSWGLTGNQPECWALMDSAVEELVSKRSALAKAVEVLKKIAEHPDKYDDGKRSYAIGWAFWNIQGMARAFIQNHQPEVSK